MLLFREGIDNKQRNKQEKWLRVKSIAENLGMGQSGSKPGHQRGCLGGGDIWLPSRQRWGLGPDQDSTREVGEQGLGRVQGWGQTVCNPSAVGSPGRDVKREATPHSSSSRITLALCRERTTGRQGGRGRASAVPRKLAQLPRRCVRERRSPVTAGAAGFSAPRVGTAGQSLMRSNVPVPRPSAPACYFTTLLPLGSRSLTCRHALVSTPEKGKLRRKSHLCMLWS